MVLRPIRPLPPVLREERPRLLYAAAAFMFAASAGIVARTAASTLFLTAYDPGLIAYMYVGSALLLIAASAGAGALLGRLQPWRLAMFVGLGGAVLAVILRIVLAGSWRPAAAIVYLASELLSKVPVLLFWGIAALLFNPREGKRLFVWIGAAGTVACAVAGASIVPLTRWISTEDLLIVVAIQLAMFAAIAVRFSRWSGGAQPPDTIRGSSRGFGYYGALLGQHHPRNLAILTMLSTATLVAVDYLFKVAARNEFTGDALAAFFGAFYSWTSIAALVFQLVLVHIILQRGGVRVGAVILPLALLICAAGVVVTFNFGWIVALKFLDPLLDFTINAAAVQLFYLGIRKQTRTQVRTFVEGMVRPVAVALTGLALVALMGSLSLRNVAIAIVILTVLWLIAAFRAHESYLAGLLDSIGSRRFELADEAIRYRDKSLEQHFRDSIRTADDSAVPYLLGVLPDLGDIDWTPEYRMLLQRESPEIKVLALRFLRDHGDSTDLETVPALLDHPSSAVRREAVLTLARLGGSDAAETLMGLVHDDDLDVRSAVTAELMRIGDLDGLVAACVSLKEMLVSPEERFRRAAADALSQVDHKGLGRPLSILLHDPSIEVRRAALEACGARGSSETIPAIIGMLGDPDVGLAASDVLVTFGEQLFPHLDSVVATARSPRPGPIALRIPQILARTKTPRALNLLSDFLDAPDLEMRTEVTEAYWTMLRGLRAPDNHSPKIEAAVARALTHAAERLELTRILQSKEGATLVCHALREEFNGELRISLMLLQTLYPSLEANSLWFSLNDESGERRSQAIEILDSVVHERIKSRLLPLLEPLRGGDEDVQNVEDLNHPVSGLMDPANADWVAAGAAYLSAESRIDSSLERVKTLLTHSTAAVRETALYALSRLAPGTQVQTAARGLVEDPDESVRRLAKSILVQGESEATA